MNQSFKYLIRVLPGIYFVSFFFICFFLDGYTSNVISYESHFSFSEFLCADKNLNELDTNKLKLIGQSLDFKVTSNSQKSLKTLLHSGNNILVGSVNKLCLFRSKRTILIRAPSSILFT